ncbi:MAG: recombination mediator RecR [Bacilli bacterium]
MNYPEPIINLINCFKRLPGIGEKTAERMALATIKLDNKTVDTFSKSIIQAKYEIKRCKKCNNYSTDDICSICNNKSRENKTICVVEEPKNINLFEKTGSFNGLYHVLDGLISPLDGINPEDINLKSLFKRIKDEDIEEVIIAVKTSIEGETTSLYILKMLEDTKTTVSKIAHGVPMGADIDYLDTFTLEMALEDRKKISKI